MRQRNKRADRIFASRAQHERAELQSGVQCTYYIDIEQG